VEPTGSAPRNGDDVGSVRFRECRLGGVVTDRLDVLVEVAVCVHPVDEILSGGVVEVVHVDGRMESVPECVECRDVLFDVLGLATTPRTVDFEAFVVVLPRTERLVDAPLEADLVTLAIDTNAELWVEEAVTAFRIADFDLEVAAVKKGGDDGELGFDPRFEGFVGVREYRSLLAFLEVGTGDDTHGPVSFEQGVYAFKRVR